MVLVADGGVGGNQRVFADANALGRHDDRSKAYKAVLPNDEFAFGDESALRLDDRARANGQRTASDDPNIDIAAKRYSAADAHVGIKSAIPPQEQKTANTPPRISWGSQRSSDQYHIGSLVAGFADSNANMSRD